MAYYDESGKITIDEVAANKDLKDLSIATEHFLTAKDYLNQIISISSTFSGNTAKSIDEETRILLNELNRIIDANNELSEQIKATVEKYKKIDESIKNIIC